MKPKPSPDIKVTVTTTTSITIQGQTFEMTLEEMKSMHDKIGKAIGVENPIIKYIPMPQEPRRPYYPPVWPYQLERDKKRFAPPYEVTCSILPPNPEANDFRECLKRISVDGFAQAVFP